MRSKEFRSSLEEWPFRPIRVTLPDGRTYDVLHPELARVGRGVDVIGLVNGKVKPVFDRMVTVSLLHVMQVKPIEKPMSSTK